VKDTFGLNHLDSLTDQMVCKTVEGIVFLDLSVTFYLDDENDVMLYRWFKGQIQYFCWDHWVNSEVTESLFALEIINGDMVPLIGGFDENQD
jgi:hypothetical protein